MTYHTTCQAVGQLKVNHRWEAPGPRVPVNWVLVHMSLSFCLVSAQYGVSAFEGQLVGREIADRNPVGCVFRVGALYLDRPADLGGSRPGVSGRSR